MSYRNPILLKNTLKRIWMQTKPNGIGTPKVIKNHFLLYYANDYKRILREIYTKAALLLDTPKGFYISSDVYTQNEQLFYLCLAKNSHFETKNLLKKELLECMKTMNNYFGVVEFSKVPAIKKESFAEDIQAIAQDVDMIFIESFILQSQEDIKMAYAMKQLAQMLSIRIEIGLVCSKEWLEKLRTMPLPLSILS